MSLFDYGWSDSWAEKLNEIGRGEGTAARVVAEHRELYRVHTGSEEISARISGKLRHEALSHVDLPAVGDWVVVRSTPRGTRRASSGISPWSGRVVPRRPLS
jgi:ribosome biogenesis GTPase